MSEAKHSLGPWEKAEHHSNGEFLISCDCSVIAGVHSWHEDCAEEGEANAYLIAAAPELLEALQSALMALVGYLPAHRNAVTDAAIAKASAAIAKAQGQEGTVRANAVAGSEIYKEPQQ